MTLVYARQERDGPGPSPRQRRETTASGDDETARDASDDRD